MDHLRQVHHDHDCDTEGCLGGVVPIETPTVPRLYAPADFEVTPLYDFERCQQARCQSFAQIRVGTDAYCPDDGAVILGLRLQASLAEWQLRNPGRQVEREQLQRLADRVAEFVGDLYPHALVRGEIDAAGLHLTVALDEAAQARLLEEAI